MRAPVRIAFLAVTAAVAVAVAITVAAPRAARADPVLTPITDRNYDVDLTVGSAYGAPRTIGMGGTMVTVEGASGLLGNPGASAVRPLASQGKWDWDLTITGFVPNLGSDFDNNGLAEAEHARARLFAFGVLVYWGPWSLGIGGVSVTYNLAPMPDPAGGAAPASAEVSATVARLALARTFLDESLSIGAALRIGELSIAERAAGSDALTSIFSSSTLAGEVGAMLLPPGASWRWGLRLAVPLGVSDVVSTCDPNNCRGYILPTHVVMPWEVALGAAWRLGPAAWNQRPTARFRDEKALVVAADLVVAGSLSGAGGVEAFVARQLQRSGEHVTLSPRLGFEYEWLPGRLRVRLGSYWEPSRYEGVNGRIHGTLGAEIRLFSFHFWDLERRVGLSLGSDAASHYANIGLSFGFWH
jgi:hypothetical protein